MSKYNFKAVVIGVSAGGFRTMQVLLSMIPEDFPLPIIIVQHRKADTDDYYIESLNKKSNLEVKEADEKEKIKNGKVYIAPADYHLLVEKDFTFSLSVDEPVSYARPSIDVLFETAANAYGSHLIGIVLTGANFDGSNGIKAIKENGGYTIAQDPQTSEVAVMPQSAIDTKCINKILNLEDIPLFLLKLNGELM